MIYAFTGKTGSGKTYRMVAMAYRYWLNGTDIYSNTILDFVNFGGSMGVNIDDNPDCFTRLEHIKNKIRYAWSKIRNTDYIPLSRGRIIYFEDISEILEAKNGLILFDEAQVLFNARNWESLPNEFQYKLQQHRKHKLDLFCTTQNMGTIDISYRRLVQEWFHHEPIFQIGSVWFGVFRSRKKDVDKLYNSVDDIAVEDIKVKFFIISFLSRRLYDTMYDIGFKRFRVVWLNYSNRKKAYIIPKNESLKSVLRQMSTLKSASNQNK